MASKQYHLWGDNASTARAIETPEAGDFEELQNLIASHFAVVDAKGKTPRRQSDPADLQGSASSTMTANSQPWLMCSARMSP